MKKLELLAPCGDFERLISAIHFGANAVYFAGKKFGLRAFANNFDEEEIIKAVNYAHERNVRVYVTVNILAHNEDFNGLVDYLKFLDKAKVDGVIVSDLGIASLVKEHTSLELHVSTQANVTNIHSAKMWVKMGAKRLVLARELSIKEIKEIKDELGEDIDIECFGHGAMCISYSGRCLLSNYLTGRDSNKGECAQPCRWNYALGIKNEIDEINYFPIQEDARGTYVLNSKDLCMVRYIKELVEAGVTSLKIEGRMKTNYYVSTTVNAYRRAIDDYYENKKPTFDYEEELRKTASRDFTTGFYFGDTHKENLLTSKQAETYKYIAVVLENSKDDYVLIEHRNKFVLGDELEILSNNDSFNKKFIVTEILDLENNPVSEVKRVKEHVYIKYPYKLNKYDILRKKIQ